MDAQSNMRLEARHAAGTRRRAGGNGILFTEGSEGGAKVWKISKIQLETAALSGTCRVEVKRRRTHSAARRFRKADNRLGHSTGLVIQPAWGASKAAVFPVFQAKKRDLR